METPKIEKPRLDRRIKRNLFLLTACQAVGQSANSMMLAATMLSVVTFYPHRDLAALPITMQHLGVMLWVFPANLLMQRMGRRFGFRVGSLFGMAGALTCAAGLYTENFPLMCLGGLILGYAVSCLQTYRFAAVEMVPQEFRSKAIGWVTSGGVAASMIGPAAADWSYDKLFPFYLGTYLCMVVVHVVVFTVMAFIEFPPPPKLPAASTATPEERPRPLRVIASQPRFIAAVITAMVSYGTMSFLMGASPLAIVGCGLSQPVAHWVIFMHVMGMFLPSFFSGTLIQRFGVMRVMFAGAAVMLGGIAVALAGVGAWNFRIALTMNGIGWNLLYVSATTLVTTCYRPWERAKAQAMNDFLIFGTTATASFMAGFLEVNWGWFPMNRLAIGIVMVAVTAVTWLSVQQWQERRAALAPIRIGE